jgi:CheY-like chemotaxis protein
MFNLVSTPNYRHDRQHASRQTLDIAPRSLPRPIAGEFRIWMAPPRERFVHQLALSCRRKCSTDAGCLNPRGGRGKRKIVESSSILTGVIVADDDPIIRSILRAALEAIDLDVFIADNGLEAVRLAARIQAALIILDLKMPQLNGLVACQHIRQLPGNAQTPIVMLTSSYGNDFEAAAASVGVTEYHVKPFRTALLMQAVARFLPMSDAARDLIRRGADRANGIAEATTAPAG